LIFEISDLMLSDWVSFLAYPNLFGIKGFVVVVVNFLEKQKLIVVSVAQNDKSFSMYLLYRPLSQA
jgi:hypothetical protein